MWGGAKFLKGGDIPRRFAPWGAIFLGESPGGGRISWGGESPVTPVSYGFYVVSHSGLSCVLN